VLFSIRGDRNRDLATKIDKHPDTIPIVIEDLLAADLIQNYCSF